MKLTLSLVSAAALALAACASSTTADIALAPEAPDGAIKAVPMPAKPLDVSKTLQRIVFASCAQQNEDQSIWDRIAAENADLLLYTGDNVYGDVRSGDRSMPELKAAYMRLAQSAPFARARAASPMLTTWDDHDYGLNDTGGNFKLKAEAEALYEYVWALGSDDPRSQRPGVYGAWMIGEAGRRVQVIMLDTRYFSSPLKPSDQMNERGKERWVPDADPAKTMLGADQWAFLEAELKKPADLRLLVSSIQVLSEGHGWEAWRQFPLERQRLYDLIRSTGAEDIIILSGDRHAAALYERKDVLPYPLFEATSSSLNLPASKWRAESGETWMEPDPNRLGDMYYDANYGRIDIDWVAKSASVTIRAADGSEVRARTVSF
jgi:alkaline phosphatase D